ncbi:zinc finger CCCH domain-containing protein 7B-like isoform 2-T2 [Spinachia spinachia]
MNSSLLQITSMDPGRQKRKQDIRDSLKFIQSSLAYPEPEGYQDFLTRLVCNLLDEGNMSFRDSDWNQALRDFSEGLNVSSYAAAEDIQIPDALQESLYVNRAAAFHSVGAYERGVMDCDRALAVCKESRRALYRKALCLKELGKYKEAYDCTTSCLLDTRLDQRVNELALELAIHLGLKNRKPYVGIKVPGALVGNGTAPAPCSHPVSSAPGTLDRLEDSELMGDDLDSLLDGFPNGTEPTEEALSVPQATSTGERTVPSALPAPTPQLPPAFFSSAVSQLNSLDFFSSGGYGTPTGTLDALDDLLASGLGGGASATNLAQNVEALDVLGGLDSLDDFLGTTPGTAANEAERELGNMEKSLDELLDELNPLETDCGPGVQSGDGSLDALDSFPSVEGVVEALPVFSVGGTGLDTLSDFSSTDSRTAAARVMRSPKNNYKEKSNPALVATSNPLSSTHEFLQACSSCFPRLGQGIYTFVHKPNLVHSCRRDVLLCRLIEGYPSDWTRVRQIPNWSSFTGPFVLCRELLNSGNLGLCKYGENCTFAYNQLEIDVWTEERKGTLDRNLLFDTSVLKLDPVNSVIRLLHEDKGMFMFLCQECYDIKPRIISKRCRDDHTICSNLDARHTFDANRCLAFVVQAQSVNYKKVRPLSVLCHLDLCRQAIRYGCKREDDCYYAHSVIELKTWRVQRNTGISPDEIVKISTKFNEKQGQNSSKHKENRLSTGGDGSKPREGAAGKSPNMKMKFACAQCLRDGLISEPNKALKHCTAKARHTWTKERWVLLVKSLERSKWVQVRPLPHAKNFPVQYEICTQMLKKKKCNYSGNCTFAHSQEEKEMWMYMKNNNLLEMQHMYDMWLSLTAQIRQADGAIPTQQGPEDKYIAMPTDFAEPMNGFHCRLCGRHSNSERQWQQHISTEKHKDRVFSCEGEDEALTWSHRFPGPCLDLCLKFDAGCPGGVSCDYAHSLEELREWTERRDFLRQKLAKAREDMLIMPDEFDFGKFNFLLRD